MKKLISTKMKIFMAFLLIGSITFFTSSMVVLYRSDFKLSDYTNFGRWDLGWNNHHYYDYSNTFLDEPLTNIQNLNMDFTGYDVELEVHSGSNLIINGNPNFSSVDNSLNVTNVDGTLTILPSNISRNILIKLPSSYNNNLDFKFTDGYANLSNMTLKTLKIQCVNADLDINVVTLTSGDLSTTNGDITLKDISSNDLSANTLDGEIYSANLKGNVNLTTIEGDIFAGLSNEINNSKFNTTNGDVNLELPPDNNFLIDYNTVSGDFDQYSNSSNFNKYDIKRNNRNYKITIGTGAIPISVTTVDGDLSF